MGTPCSWSLERADTLYALGLVHKREGGDAVAEPTRDIEPDGSRQPGKRRSNAHSCIRIGQTASVEHPRRARCVEEDGGREPQRTTRQPPLAVRGDTFDTPAKTFGPQPAVFEQ